MTSVARPESAKRKGAPWGRLCLGLLGGYGATSLGLAALALVPGLSIGERVNWALILAPVVAVLFLAYPFLARSPAIAARNLAVIAAAGAAALLAFGPGG